MREMLGKLKERSLLLGWVRGQGLSVKESKLIHEWSKLPGRRKPEPKMSRKKMWALLYISQSLSLCLCLCFFSCFLAFSPSHQINPLLESYTEWIRCNYCDIKTQTVKNRPAMWETRVWSLGQEDPLEEEMATDSSILAWRIPWKEEPGSGLQPMGSERAGHNWETNIFTFHNHINHDFVCDREKPENTEKNQSWTLRIYGSLYYGWPGGSVVKNLPANAEDLGSIRGLGRSPGEGNGSPTPVFLPVESHGQSMGLQTNWTWLSN